MARKNYERVQDETNVEEVLSKDAVVDEKVTKPFMGVVIGGLSLNVRKTPGGDIVSSLPDGAQVRVIESADDKWYRIESPVGFVMKDFIKKA